MLLCLSTKYLLIIIFYLFVCSASGTGSVKLWEFLSLTHYGKYEKATYPYLLWEPSDQPTIQSAADVYLKRGNMHEPGLSAFCLFSLIT